MLVRPLDGRVDAAFEGPRGAVQGGSDGGGPGTAVQERELAEGVAGGVGADEGVGLGEDGLAAVVARADADRGGAGLEDVEVRLLRVLFFSVRGKVAGRGRDDSVAVNGYSVQFCSV